MLSLKIICVGKAKGEWSADASSHFTKLISRYAKLEIIEVPGCAKSPDGSIEGIKKTEAERITKALGSIAYAIALDLSGKTYTSARFAHHLEKLSSASTGPVHFVIGGAYGLSHEFIASANETLCLSTMTLSHQIARVTLLEQLYRAFSILANSEYHK